MGNGESEEVEDTQSDATAADPLKRSVLFPPAAAAGLASVFAKRAAGIALAVALVISAVYAYSCLNTGWIPQDDGTLAQSAVRVLDGQMPHRDFVENYTGGLSYVHALAFRVFGTHLVALRRCVFLFFLASLLAIAYIASRFVSALPAAGLTLLAAAWTLPVYPAAMPSWYNLFFALFGVAALFRYFETSSSRWLFVAGACGGLSFLIKVTGLYYIAAVLLLFLFREQQLSADSEAKSIRPARLYQWFVLISLLSFVGAIALLIRSHLGINEFIHFLMPVGALVAALIWREVNDHAGANAARFAGLLRMVGPFLAGVLVPVVLFLVPYLRSRSVGALYHGLFVMGVSRAESLATKRPGGPWLLPFAVLPLLLLLRAIFWKSPAGRLRGALVAVAGAILLLIPSASLQAKIWTSAGMMTPLVVLAGVAILVFRPGFADDLSATRQQQIMLLLALAGVCSLVQFPCAWAIYFCYVAPLTILALGAIISTKKQPASRFTAASLLLFYVLFGVHRLQPNRIYAAWFGDTWPPEQVLQLPRAGGLMIKYPGLYEDVTRIIRQHAAKGSLIATPDCPELYFLAGLQNPNGNDAAVTSNELLRDIEADGVNVVVINESPVYPSSRIAPEVQQIVSARFPYSRNIGIYRIFWKNE